MGTREVVSVILAAGRGSRMSRDEINKVCHTVNGEPVIAGAVRMYGDCGIDRHICVVGHLADQVKDTLSEFEPAVDFAYQHEQKGTGHAARCGAALLEDEGYDGLVLVVAGDKVLKQTVVEDLISGMDESEADLIFVTGDKEANLRSGRVVKNASGQPVAIVEASEIALSELLAEIEELIDETDQPVSCEFLMERMRHYFPSESKLEKACKPLYELAQQQENLTPAQLDDCIKSLLPKVRLDVDLGDATEPLRAHEADRRTDEVNLSVYLFRAPALYEGLSHIQTDNAQGEEYLTDVVKYLATATDDDGNYAFKLETLRISDPTDVMGFNTEQELQQIRDYYSSPSVTVSEDVSGADTMPVHTWKCLFADRHPDVQEFLEATYGDNWSLQEEKRSEYLTALEHYERNYEATDEVFIVRSPGRINLMGRHVDHRGGDVNVIAISDECLAVVSPRDDDRVELSNSMPDRFADDAFSIREMIENLELSDWFTCINSPKTLALVNDGDWDNYIKAATLRLQNKFYDRPLRGMNMAVHSNVPIGSGLSSSSAIVVAAAEACVEVNSLPVQPHLLVDLCGEGEWFVGTRGGSGDHAAIKLGRRGEVANMSFFPFRVKGFVPFPPGYRILIVNSGIQAKKMQGARAEYNSRVLAYVAGEIWFKLTFPEYSEQIEHLRDISPQNLNISDVELYKMLQEIPMTLGQSDLRARWDEMSERDQERISALLATDLPEQEPLYVRDILLYGLAEIARSRLCSEYLRKEDVEGFGRLCHISHDGDRVVEYDENLEPSPWNYRVTDEYLRRLVKASNSPDPAVREKARLHWQPGRYACSVPEIDMIVDVAKRTEGVHGAQMAGAGLGGCAMALVREDDADRVAAEYARRGFKTQVYSPVQGAGVVRLS